MLKAGVDVGASELGWTARWLREGDGVGVSMQECKGGGEAGGEWERHPPCKDRGAFLCHTVMREGCFIFRGFGEKVLGVGSTKR